MVKLPEREPHPAERARSERGEHVGLVLCAIGGDAQQRSGLVLLVGDARVVSSRERDSAEPLGELEHGIETDVAVAADARVGRLAVRKAGDERLDDAGAELAPQVEREVREPHRVGKRARLGHR